VKCPASRAGRFFCWPAIENPAVRAGFSIMHGVLHFASLEHGISAHLMAPCSMDEFRRSGGILERRILGRGRQVLHSFEIF
jgi:hypothetical protein